MERKEREKVGIERVTNCLNWPGNKRKGNKRKGNKRKGNVGKGFE